MKYEHHGTKVPLAQRGELNEKVLYLIDSGTAQQSGISPEDIYNAYTGEGGLHGLKQGDFDSYHDYSEAKKEKEAGQFFTPASLCQFLMGCLNLSVTDLVADLTSGMGNMFNFVPTEANAYGCEIDHKAHKVARFLYPEANLTLGDIRIYAPQVSFDYVVGNPPFNLSWTTESGEKILSQFYYCLKAAELLKPLGIMALIVPRSFLTDTFFEKKYVKALEDRFSFLGQVGLPANAFAYLGVAQFATKIQFWQRKTDMAGWTAKRYSTALDGEMKALTDLDCQAEEFFHQLIEVPKADLEQNKGKILLELSKQKSTSKGFDYEVRKLLYQIKTHPATREKYGKCFDYVRQFYTQKQPKDMTYEQWLVKRITETKVLSYLKKALRRQNVPPERDVTALVKQKFDFIYKGYSHKARQRLTTEQRTPVPVYEAVMDYEPEDFPGFERLLRRKKREYETQEQKFSGMTEDIQIADWLLSFRLWDAENEEHIQLNALQRHDINLTIQKRYTLLQWEQGSGKTLAAIAVGKYRMDHSQVHSTWVLSSAISIRNNWDA